VEIYSCGLVLDGVGGGTGGGNQSSFTSLYTAHADVVTDIYACLTTQDVQSRYS